MRVPRQLLRICALGCLVFLATAATRAVQMQNLVGTWQNKDEADRGISRLRIDLDGPKVTVRAWGRCVPQDCPWGAIDATPYGPGVRADPMRQPLAISARFVTGSAETLVIVRPTRPGELDAEVFTRYTDRSGRHNVFSTASFRRLADPR